MKSIFIILALVVWTSGRGWGADGASSAASGKSQPARLFIHGWEVQAVSAIRRAALAELRPQFSNGRPVGSLRATAQPKGQFFIVELQYSWTSSGAPTDPLWVGKPSVQVTDATGATYAPVGVLTRQAGEYVTLGMDALSVAKDRSVPPNEPHRVLVYFDVPASAKALKLVLAPGWPAVAIGEVDDFSTGNIELPR